MEFVFGDIRERASNYLNEDVEPYIILARSKLEGIADVLHSKLQEEIPTRVISEVTITNTETRHEGRVDSIFEYPEHEETVEWKTYVDGSISAGDRFQTISNGMLVNYRYGKLEDNFDNNRLTIITPQGTHHPRPTELAMDTIRKARSFILETLNGQRTLAKLPYQGVCNSCSFLNACIFYRNDRVDNDQKRLLWRRRYKIIEKRGSSHKNKFIFAAGNLEQSKSLRITDFPYTIESIDLSVSGYYSIRMKKQKGTHRLYNGDSVRIIAMEQGIPILACISCNGSVKSIHNDTLVVDVYSGRPYQLVNFPILLLRTDVDLTKRELEAVDFVQRNRGVSSDFAFALIGEHIDEFS
jgi:hypothetical protein